MSGQEPFETRWLTTTQLGSVLRRKKMMTAVNSTTIPCEPHRLPIDLSVLTTLCLLDFNDFRSFLYAFGRSVQVSGAKNYE